MGTFKTNSGGTRPHLTEKELTKELPHGGSKVDDKINPTLTNEARERVAAAINASKPNKKEETQTTWWDAYNSWSTYKPQ
jgi:hypothetical protein